MRVVHVYLVLSLGLLTFGRRIDNCWFIANIVIGHRVDHPTGSANHQDREQQLLCHFSILLRKVGAER